MYVDSSLDMRGVLMPNVVLVAESIANGAHVDQRRPDEVPDIDTVIGALSLLTVAVETGLHQRTCCMGSRVTSPNESSSSTDRLGIMSANWDTSWYDDCHRAEHVCNTLYTRQCAPEFAV